MSATLHHSAQALWGLCSGLWCWITSGQNATAIGIIAATILSAFTLVVLARTLKAVNRQAIAADLQSKAADAQAKAAEVQAQAAQRQIEVSEQLRIVSERAAIAAEEQVKAAIASSSVSDAQRKATEDSAKAERAHSELIRHQTLAQLRPILVFGNKLHPTMGGAVITFVENHGTGVALDIKVKLDRPKTLPKDRMLALSVDFNVLGPNKSANFTYDFRNTVEGTIYAYCESLDGRHFVTTATINGQNFKDQKPFEINDKGGWLSEPPVPLVE